MFLLVDNKGLCLEVRNQSRAEEAKVELNLCTGASSQLWSLESLRQNDYEILYQADKHRYNWISSPPDPVYPYPVEVEDARQICRAQNTAWIGVILAGQCAGKTYEGVPFGAAEYESLFQALA
jgi:Ricin-type beta-trefoil lectin domain-like